MNSYKDILQRDGVEHYSDCLNITEDASIRKIQEDLSMITYKLKDKDDIPGKGVDYCILNSEELTSESLCLAATFLKTNGSLFIFGISNASALYSHFKKVCVKSDVIIASCPNKFNINPDIMESLGLKDSDIRRPRLLSHQVKSFKWWDSVGRRGILALDMGLGKTFMACYMLYKNSFIQKYKRILVAAPSQIIPKWEQELKSLGVDYINLSIKGNDNLKTDGVINLISYEAIRFKSTKKMSPAELIKFPNKPLLKKISRDLVLRDGYDLIIADESHSLNQYDSVNTRVISRLVKDTTHLMFMTGTPFSNGLQDSFSQLSIIKPGLVGKNITNFRSLFLEDVSPSKKYSSWQVRDNMKELLTRKVYSLTYFKKLVDGVILPDLNVINCPYELSKEQHKMNKHIRKNKVLPIITEETPKGIPIDNPSLAVNLTRRVCSGFLKYEYQFSSLKVPVDVTFDMNPKNELLLSLLQKLEGKQALIWINYIDSGNNLVKDLKKLGYKVELINGSVDKEERARIIDAFYAGSIQLIVAHPKTIGVGLDFQNAKYQIYYELSYSLTEYAQAIKRSHRIGQDQPVFIYRLVANKSIEEKVVQALDKKVDTDKFLFKNYLEGFDA